MKIPTTIATCWVLLFALSFSSHELNAQNSVEPDWLQYGHNRNWTHSTTFEIEKPLTVEWSIPTGKGRSQVIGTDGSIFCASGTSRKDNEATRLTTTISALDGRTGKTNWTYEFNSTMHDEQESFGGSTPAPQSTPAIAGDRLFVVDFSGHLHCLNCIDGTLQWQIDLVSKKGATPVQFGYSSSPVIEPQTPDRVYVLAAGKNSGFYCLDISSGTVIWKAPCSTCSYATPVAATFSGVRQWVLVSETSIVGVSAENGEPLWSYPMPKPGLTNVPSPIVVDSSRLIVSGQGIGGTRCLEISRNNADWNVQEKWHTRKLQLFYTNWLLLNKDVIVGCTDKYLAALDTRDGTILGRWRGFNDGNIVMANSRLLILDGKGHLHVLEPFGSPESRIESFVQIGKYPVAKGKCWTPISIIADQLLVRDEDQLVCLKPGGQNDKQTITNQLPSHKTFNFREADTSESPVELTEQIFQIFDDEGPQAAMAQYSKLRSENKLNEEARLILAEAAIDSGQADLGKQILADAVEDFPNSRELQRAFRTIMVKDQQKHDA